MRPANQSKSISCPAFPETAFPTWNFQNTTPPHRHQLYILLLIRTLLRPNVLHLPPRHVTGSLVLYCTDVCQLRLRGLSRSHYNSRGISVDHTLANRVEYPMAAPAVWVVVGASRGIGLEWVRQLLARGNHVLATVRDVAKASQLWTLAGSAAMGRCQLFECDVASEASINVLYEPVL